MPARVVAQSRQTGHLPPRSPRVACPAMAVASKDIALLTALRARDVRFTKTLTIGRQSLVADEATVAAGFAEGGWAIAPVDAARTVTAGGGYAEALFRYLGAESAESIDASDYQQS